MILKIGKILSCKSQCKAGCCGNCSAPISASLRPTQLAIGAIRFGPEMKIYYKNIKIIKKEYFRNQHPKLTLIWYPHAWSVVIVYFSLEVF